MVVTDDKDLEHVLKTKFELYMKGPDFHETFFDMLGNGILNSDGDSWKSQRKLASHMFSIKVNYVTNIYKYILIFYF